MKPENIHQYNEMQSEHDCKICEVLMNFISENLSGAESKLWHAHPVWFLNGNPIVGYSKQKAGIRLMFWSGKSFGEERLNVKGEKFQDASIFYTSVEDVNEEEVKCWLQKAEKIQWDYKNIVKRKGELVRLK